MESIVLAGEEAEAARYHATKGLSQAFWLTTGYLFFAGLLLVGLQRPAHAPVMRNMGIFFMLTSCCMPVVFNAEVRFWMKQPQVRESVHSTVCAVALLVAVAGAFSLVFFHYTAGLVARDLGIGFLLVGVIVLCVERDCLLRGVHWLLENPLARLKMATALWLASMATVVGLSSASVPAEDLQRGNYQAALGCMYVLLAASSVVILAGYKEIAPVFGDWCQRS